MIICIEIYLDGFGKLINSAYYVGGTAAAPKGLVSQRSQHPFGSNQ